MRLGLACDAQLCLAFRALAIGCDSHRPGMTPNDPQEYESVPLFLVSVRVVDAATAGNT